MASVTGFGGAFVRANDPKALYGWYERHLGLTRSEGALTFPALTQRAQTCVGGTRATGSQLARLAETSVSHGPLRQRGGHVGSRQLPSEPAVVAPHAIGSVDAVNVCYS
jgi:hypothetical protein